MGIIERTPPMPLAEFIRLYDMEGPFEYVNGERIPMSPTKSGHNVIARTLLLALCNYSIPKGLGEAFMEAPFALSDAPDWVKGSRVPDVMFFRAERLADYKAKTPDWREKPFILVPDLVVEIVSPTDRYTDVNEKVARYLADGVQIVWVFDAQKRTVVVHSSVSKTQQALGPDDTLDGGEVVPGFTVHIASLFE